MRNRQRDEVIRDVLQTAMGSGAGDFKDNVFCMPEPLAGNGIPVAHD